MPPTCSTHRRRAPLPVRRPEDALTALALATDAGRDTCVVVGSLDGERRPLALLVVDGAAAADLALAVDVVLAGVRRLGDASPVTAMFLACSGGAAVPAPGPAECAALAQLDRRLADAGITLLDWFMLSEGSATSVAHVAGWVTDW